MTDSPLKHPVTPGIIDRDRIQDAATMLETILSGRYDAEPWKVQALLLHAGVSVRVARDLLSKAPGESDPRPPEWRLSGGDIEGETRKLITEVVLDPYAPGHDVLREEHYRRRHPAPGSEIWAAPFSGSVRVRDNFGEWITEGYVVEHRRRGRARTEYLTAETFRDRYLIVPRPREALAVPPSTSTS